MCPMANKLKLWLTKQLMWWEHKKVEKFLFEQDTWPQHLAHQRWMADQRAKGLPTHGEIGVCTKEMAEDFKATLEEVTKRDE